jgi:hypothetical protein
MKVIQMFGALLLLLVALSCQKESGLTTLTDDMINPKISITNELAAQAPKVDICHYSGGSGTWHVINVSANAMQAHLNHGDVLLVDADEDGWVEADNECVPGGDCDDADPAVNPGAEEVCGDEIDNNCDGEIDEDCIIGPWAEDYPHAFNITSAGRYAQDGLLAGGCADYWDIWNFICFDYCNSGCDTYIHVYGNYGGEWHAAYTSTNGYLDIPVTEAEGILLLQEIDSIAASLGMVATYVNCSNPCDNLAPNDPSTVFPTVVSVDQ